MSSHSTIASGNSGVNAYEPRNYFTAESKEVAQVPTEAHENDNAIPQIFFNRTVINQPLQEDSQRTLKRKKEQRGRVQKNLAGRVKIYNENDPIWRCYACKIPGNLTPQFRKGPTGDNSLCNACGLRWAKFGDAGIEIVILMPPKMRWKEEHKNDPIGNAIESDDPEVSFN